MNACRRQGRQQGVSLHWPPGQGILLPPLLGRITVMASGEVTPYKYTEHRQGFLSTVDYY